jgi:putative ABC transport system permease protein
MLAKFLGRLLLLAFPKRFRDRLGRPLVQTLLTDSRGESGRLAPGRLAAGAVDVVSAGLTERLESPRRTLRMTLEATWLDLRLAARRLNHSRTFVVVALLTLALGIGANAALFQLLEAVRLRPLAIPSPHELVELRIENFDNPRGNFTNWRSNATHGIWEEIRRRQGALSGVFAWSSSSVRLSADGREPRFASLILVTGGFFSTLGVGPELGRVLTDADDVKGCANPAVVLSHAFWQTEFGGDRRIIGKPLALGRDTYEIVGVAPRFFTGLEVGRRFDVAAPLCSEWLPPGSSSRLDSGSEWFLIIMGRLKTGWTIERASAHLASISPAIFDAALPANYPAANVAGYRAFRLGAFDASKGVSAARDRYSQPLWFLQATALLVLLVGCANLANLMLARGATRQREIAARAALGATRGQLIRVVLAESVLLSIAGAAAGAWLARELSTALVGFLGSEANPLILDLAFDWRALAFIALAATLACILSGMGAAWRAGATSPTSLLHAGRGVTDSRTRVTLRQGLVVAQVALSLVLLTGALLFSRSLHNLTSQDLGLRPDGLTIAYVDASGMNVPIEKRAEFKRAMLDRLASTPGVVGVAETSVVQLSGITSGYKVWMDGRPPGAAGERTGSNFADVDSSFFQTIGIPLVAGRPFDARDTPGAPGVAIVNETFVRRLLPDGSSPLGRRVWREATSTSPETPYEIVGIVRDSKYRSLRETVRPTLYRAVSQQRAGTFYQLVIRTSSDVLPAGAVLPALKDAFRQVGPAIVPTFQGYREMIDRSLLQDRLLAGLSAFFGVLAALLATLGLYGSVSFAVSRRTSEIGLRMALGASRLRIVRMILSEAFVLVIIGCAAGGALAITLARGVGSMAYGLAPTDPATLAAACLFLAVIAFAASAAPARRASRLDPMRAFRVE